MPTLTGKVYDAVTRKQILGVTVNGAGKTTTTTYDPSNPDCDLLPPGIQRDMCIVGNLLNCGWYSLSPTQTGAQTFAYRKTGYTSQFIVITLPTSGTVTNDVYLQPV